MAKKLKTNTYFTKYVTNDKYINIKFHKNGYKRHDCDGNAGSLSSFL